MIVSDSENICFPRQKSVGINLLELSQIYKFSVSTI